MGINRIMEVGMAPEDWNEVCIVVVREEETPVNVRSIWEPVYRVRQEKFLL